MKIYFPLGEHDQGEYREKPSGLKISWHCPFSEVLLTLLHIYTVVWRVYLSAYHEACEKVGELGGGGGGGGNP